MNVMLSQRLLTFQLTDLLYVHNYTYKNYVLPLYIVLTYLLIKTVESLTCP